MERRRGESNSVENLNVFWETDRNSDDLRQDLAVQTREKDSLERHPRTDSRLEANIQVLGQFAAPHLKVLLEYFRRRSKALGVHLQKSEDLRFEGNPDKISDILRGIGLREKFYGYKSERERTFDPFQYFNRGRQLSETGAVPYIHVQSER